MAMVHNRSQSGVNAKWSTCSAGCHDCVGGGSSLVGQNGGQKGSELFVSGIAGRICRAAAVKNCSDPVSSAGGGGSCSVSSTIGTTAGVAEIGGSVEERSCDPSLTPALSREGRGGLRLSFRTVSGSSGNEGAGSDM